MVERNLKAGKSLLLKISFKVGTLERWEGFNLSQLSQLIECYN